MGLAELAERVFGFWRFAPLVRACGPELAVFGRIGARNEADEGLCRAQRLDQRADAEDVDDALEIVGQHVQGHFRADPFQGLHLEVRRSHPVFDGAERMLDGFTPLLHLLWVLVEPPLNVFKNVFVFPAGDPALLGRGAAILDGTGPACRGPVAPQAQPPLLVGIVVDKAFAARTCWTALFRHCTHSV